METTFSVADKSIGSLAFFELLWVRWYVFIVLLPYGLVAAHVLFFLIQMSNPTFTYGWSVIPLEITTGVDLIEPQVLELRGQHTVEVPQAPGPPIIWLTLFTSMFMHGGFGHIAGNMLYLWIFGNNVEHRFGHVWFLIFYLSAGLVGSFAQIALAPDSVIPNLGATDIEWTLAAAFEVALFDRDIGTPADGAIADG